VLKNWLGKEENVKKAQMSFYYRAKANGIASLGRYEGFEGEKGSS